MRHITADYWFLCKILSILKANSLVQHLVFMKYQLGLLSILNIFSLVTGAVGITAVEAVPLRALTEHVNHISYLDSAGRPAGPTTELLRLLASRLDQDINIEIMPWARALHIAKHEPHTALYETALTEDRRTLFKWVGPLKIYRLALFGRKNKIDPALPPATLGNVYTACEARDSAYLHHWRQYGFSGNARMTLTVQKSQCRDMFLQQRADLIVWNEFFIEPLAQKLSEQGTELVRIADIDEVQLYLAFSAEHADEYIAQWQLALEQSYLDGSMRALYQGSFPEELIMRLEQFARQKQGMSL